MLECAWSVCARTVRVCGGGCRCLHAFACVGVRVRACWVCMCACVWVRVCVWVSVCTLAYVCLDVAVLVFLRVGVFGCSSTGISLCASLRLGLHVSMCAPEGLCPGVRLGGVCVCPYVCIRVCTCA